MALASARSHRLVALSLFGGGTLSLALAGCPGGGGTVPLEDVPTRLAPSYCALLDRCANPFVGPYLFGSGSCEDGIEPLIEDSFLGRASQAVRDGTVVYHGDRVDGCLTALDSAGCSLDTVVATACTDIFEGTVAAGGACAWDEECVSGYCSDTDGMCPGTCASFIGAGGSCMAEGCAPGLTCANGTCSAVSVAGGACEGAAGLSCSGIDLTCVGSEGEAPGTCRSWTEVLNGDVGDSCTIADDLCDEGLSCVFAGVEGGMARFECAAGVASGAACSQGFPDPCPDAQYCMMGAMPGMGTCTALPTAGQMCASGQCAPGLRCVVPEGSANGTCTSAARLGQPCQGNAGCLSSVCEDGVCATPGC